MRLIIRNDRDIEAVASYIAKLPRGKKYDVTISRRNEKRSIPQNKLYWAWITCISDDTGGNKDQIHEELKKSFAPRKEVASMDGELIMVPKSTTELDTKEFTNYLEQVRVFAASELGIHLPSPEEEVFNIFYDQYS